MSFATDTFTAYEQFMSRRLQPGETVVYLAELRKLGTLFKGGPSRYLLYTFVAGQPEHVKPLLHASFLEQ